MQKRGYFIIDFLVYLAIYTVLTIAAMRFLVGTSQSIFSSLRKTDRIVKAFGAFDVLKKDCQKGTATTIDNGTVLKIVWPYHVVRWQLSKNKIRRMEKRYNHAEKKWHKPSFAVLANNCETLSFKTQNNELFVQCIILLPYNKTYSINKNFFLLEGASV